MAELASLRADPRAERDGVWIDCAHIVPDLEIRTRSMGSRYFDLNRQYEAAAKRQVKNRQPNGDLKAEVQAVSNVRALIDACLVDVRGLTSGGENVTMEQLAEVLVTLEYRDLNAAAFYAAAQATEMKASDKEAALGNFQPS